MTSDAHKASATGPQQRPAFAGAAAAAAKLQISNVRFTRIAVYTGVVSLERLPADVSSRIAFTRPIVRLEGTHAIFTTTFLFRISAKSGDVVAFDLNATTELIYSMPADAEIADADLEEFGQVNVPFNAWAYWRELSQSSFCRLGLPPLALPLFRVQDAAGLMVEHEQKSD